MLNPLELSFLLITPGKLKCMKVDNTVGLRFVDVWKQAASIKITTAVT